MDGLDIVGPAYNLSRPCSGKKLATEQFSVPELFALQLRLLFLKTRPVSKLIGPSNRSYLVNAPLGTSFPLPPVLPWKGLVLLDWVLMSPAGWCGTCFALSCHSASWKHYPTAAPALIEICGPSISFLFQLIVFSDFGRLQPSDLYQPSAASVCEYLRPCLVSWA